MFSNLKEIDWDDKIIVFTGFISIILMILCYSISDGLGFGIIAYCIMMLGAGRGKEVHPLIYGIGCFYVLNFALSAIIPLLK